MDVMDSVELFPQSHPEDIFPDYYRYGFYTGYQRTQTLPELSRTVEPGGLWPVENRSRDSFSKARWKLK